MYHYPFAYAKYYRRRQAVLVVVVLIAAEFYSNTNGSCDWISIQRPLTATASRRTPEHLHGHCVSPHTGTPPHGLCVSSHTGIITVTACRRTLELVLTASAFRRTPESRSLGVAPHRNLLHGH